MRSGNYLHLKKCTTLSSKKIEGTNMLQPVLLLSPPEMATDPDHDQWLFLEEKEEPVE